MSKIGEDMFKLNDCVKVDVDIEYVRKRVDEVNQQLKKKGKKVKIYVRKNPNYTMKLVDYLLIAIDVKK